MSCSTYLESTFLLRGYLGVDIFVNKTLNSHDEDDLNEALLQASDEFESKVTPRATALSLALAHSRAPSTTSATCHQPNPLYLPVPGPTT